MKFNYKDWDIEPETAIGHDDFIYGNYVDWDKFRKEQGEQLLESFGVNLPWGKEINLSEYIEFISQDVFVNTSLIQDYLANNLIFENNNNLLYEVTIKFPSQDSEFSDKLVSAIFDYYEVPSGTKYEYELPKDLQYWNDQENEYRNYTSYPIVFEKYIQTIESIKIKVEKENDNLTKKALIFASFSITESLYKSIIVNRIPKEEKITAFSQKILDNEIDKILKGSIENKNRLFKDLFNIDKAPNQEWINLRNSLAHNIEEAIIDGSDIKFINLKSKKEEIKNINKIFMQQMEFYNQLKIILDNHLNK